MSNLMASSISAILLSHACFDKHVRMHAYIQAQTSSLRCQCLHTSFNHVSPSTHSHTHTHTVSFRFSQGRQCFQLLSTTGNVTHKYGLTKLSWNVTKQQQDLNDWSHYIKGADALFSDFCGVHNWLPPDTLIPFIQTESNQNIFKALKQTHIPKAEGTQPWSNFALVDWLGSVRITEHLYRCMIQANRKQTDYRLTAKTASRKTCRHTIKGVEKG